jgi:molybdopterin-guanine dinucleotide biosynthesis protein A
MNITPNLLGVVLAGGQSSRMGTDKARLQRGDITQLQFSQTLLKECGVDKVVVSGDQYDIADQLKQSGPLAGIYSVIEHYQTNLPKALLILPVDMPLMTCQGLHKLRQIGELSHCACHYQQHQLPLYLPLTVPVVSTIKKLCQPLSQTKETKGPAIKTLLANIPTQIVACNNPRWLINTNTPTEWQQAQQYFSS